MLTSAAHTTEDQFIGCLLGLALGDALGAPYEGGPLERALWRLIGRTGDGCARWTDDTRMSLDLAESLLAQGKLDQDDLARRFAASYAWRRGYGPSTARLLKRVRRGQPWAQAVKAVYPEGSFGNGAAMRAPVVALFYGADPARMLGATRASAVVTHAHPLGVEGAILVAVASQALLARATPAQVMAAAGIHCRTNDMLRRLDIATDWLTHDARPSAHEVAGQLGNGMTAATSCVTALYIGLRHIDARFEDLIAFTIACGGDVDTLAAMAGAMWGAYNGAARLPDVALEQRALLQATAQQLYRHVAQERQNAG